MAASVSCASRSDGAAGTAAEAGDATRPVMRCVTMRHIHALLFFAVCLLPLCLSAAEPGNEGMGNPNSYESMGWIIAGVFGIVGLANQGVQLWQFLFPRETPPPPAHATYATKAELAKIARDAKDASEEVEQQNKVELARIEKRFAEWIEENQGNHAESVRELRRTLEAFTEWQRTIERSFGRVETKVDFATAHNASSGGKK